MQTNRLFDSNGNWTLVALNICTEICKAIEPILEKYPDYDVRDLQNIIQSGLTMIMERKRR